MLSERLGVDVIAETARDGHATWFAGVLVLAVAPALRHLVPAIGLHEPDHLAHFHRQCGPASLGSVRSAEAASESVHPIGSRQPVAGPANDGLIGDPIKWMVL
jgi:hypothetical protein